MEDFRADSGLGATVEMHETSEVHTPRRGVAVSREDTGPY